MLALAAMVSIFVSGCAGSGHVSAEGRWQPEPVPDAPPSLVEVRPLREAPVLGVQVAPGRILVMAPRSWEGDALVRAVQSGVTGSVVRVVDWWSKQRIEWALLEVAWHGAAPAIAELSEEKPDLGEPLRIVSVRNSNITIVETTPLDAECNLCWMHSTAGPLVGYLRPGAPVFDDQNRVVALYESFGAGPVRPDGAIANVVNLISAVQWRPVEPRRATSDETFRQALLAEETVAKSIHLASQAHDRGDYDDAITRCAPIVEADPENGWVWQIVGSSSYHLKQYAEAADAFRAALRRTETPFLAKGFLAACAVHMGDDEQAAALAAEVAAYDDADAASLRWATFALGKSGQYEEAAAVARRALELDPDDEWTQRMLRAAEEALNPSFGRIQLGGSS